MKKKGQIRGSGRAVGGMRTKKGMRSHLTNKLNNFLRGKNNTKQKKRAFYKNVKFNVQEGTISNSNIQNKIQEINDHRIRLCAYLSSK